MGLKYKDTGSDGFFSLSPVKIALINSGIRTSKILEESAIKDYKTKRKTTRQPSMIINSFAYDLKSASEIKVIAIVQAGGPLAPHAIYVDQDRRLRNGKMWSDVNPKAPYAFMDAGMEMAEKKADEIIIEEFNSIGKPIIIGK